MGERTWDTIIVGGGSAGCALACRLTEDPEHSVLVLEAGRTDAWWDIFVHMPAALTIPIGNPRYDWRYQSDPEPHMHGRRVAHARGKLLGGSSSINGMIFLRGNPMDFEKWGADPGMKSWDYAHCLPYFKRSEHRLVGGDASRGTEGPLQLETGPAASPLFEAFFEATAEAGYARVDDLNGRRQEGFAPFDRNIVRGRRLSAARAYLHPVMGRPSLEVRCRAMTTRVLFEGVRAVGVEYLAQGRTIRQVRAGRVVLCGGAIGSPQTLQLSGVGPAELLRTHGIDVVADVPGVGDNMQDHLEVYIQHACSKPVSLQPALKWWKKPWLGYRWLFHRSGAASTNHFEGGGFLRSNDEVAYPNVLLHFLPLAIRYDGSLPGHDHGFQVHAGPMNSDVRGTLAIRSADPREHPSLKFNYLSTARDRNEWIEVVRRVREILAQPALAPFNGGETSPGAAVTTDAEILDWVARDAETALHPSCTCKMGPASDPLAVVDPTTMGVHGTEGLAVVDASVMPYVTNANIYAPTMMVAEKAADLLRGATPASPERIPWHRHRS